MLRITVHLEDTVIAADMLQPNKNWTVQLADNVTGKQHQFEATNAQLAAILALAVHDDFDTLQSDWLYKMANPVLKDCPRECYPIP